jgi:hypothetical protein
VVVREMPVLMFEVFNQRNVAVMINGVPQNDMENGWVYWSNWDGVGDATSSIQMQRGLSAVNLATPSIGGAVALFSAPAALVMGGVFLRGVGAGGFLCSALCFPAGFVGVFLALRGPVVRPPGGGFLDGAWAAAWAFSVGGSFAVSAAPGFVFFAFGAPLRLGLCLSSRFVAACSLGFAGAVGGFDAPAFAAGAMFVQKALWFFNPTVAPPKGITGQQYWYMYGAKYY